MGAQKPHGTAMRLEAEPTESTTRCELTRSSRAARWDAVPYGLRLDAVANVHGGIVVSDGRARCGDSTASGECRSIVYGLTVTIRKTPSSSIQVTPSMTGRRWIEYTPGVAGAFTWKVKVAV